MVSRTRNKARGRIPKKKNGGPDEEEEFRAEYEESRAEYEESRALRIKQNTERMKSLGIFDLSIKLNSKPPSAPRKPKSTPPPSNHSPRRSSRLKDVPRPSYSETKLPKMKKPLAENLEIRIPPGENPEIYTEEDEKLLGDSETAWILCTDGYDEDGQRIYDPILGKTCHQCRQKTIGHHTECSTCTGVTGQFCGDCLHTRYGENVSEVNENPNWVCPVCRGICNCSRCRREKGWAPTGAIYRKVVHLGFKSVAHYLVHTYRGQTTADVIAAENPVSVDGGKEKSGDVVSSLQLSGSTKEVKDLKLESDKYYGGDDLEDDGDVDSNMKLGQ